MLSIILSKIEGAKNQFVIHFQVKLLIDNFDLRYLIRKAETQEVVSLYIYVSEKKKQFVFIIN